MSLAHKEATTTTATTTTTSTTTASTEVDLTQLFPATAVRSQLYRQVTNLPRISVENAELIGTTSALFFKNFLARLSDRTIIKAVDIQQVVMETPAFAFLHQSLEADGAMTEIVQRDNRHWAAYQPKRKREGTSIAGAKKVAKVVAQDDQLKSGGNNSKTSTDPIIADDDDYD